MDYRQQLLDTYDSGDFDALINLANEIRKVNSKESFFGLRKNYFNIIHSHRSYTKAKEVLEKLGFHVIGCAASQFLKKVQDGKIKVEDAAKNIAIVTKSDTMAGTLAALKFPYTEFTFHEMNNWHEIYNARRGNLPEPDLRKWLRLTNEQTSDIFEFDEVNINGLLRDEKIDSILED
jgi:hypothetical protein